MAITKRSISKKFEQASQNLNATGMEHATKNALQSTLSDMQERLNAGVASTSELRTASDMLAIIETLCDHGIAQEKLARVDDLTQLTNKMGTLDATEDMIARAKRDNSAVAVFFIDLTKFKPINDTLGHKQGDEALQLVAEKMQETVRDGDIVGRVGGDEFVIAMSNQDPEHDFSIEKQHLVELFDGNIIYQDAEQGDYPIGGDIGLAIIADGETAEAATARADHLMYEAKQIRHRELREAQEVVSRDPQ